MEYPDPEFVGCTILDGLNNFRYVREPEFSYPGGRDSDTPYLWGPPLFTANPSIVIQIHTPDFFYFDRTSIVEEIFKFISDDESDELFMEVDTFTYASGINFEETDHTVLQGNFKAFFDEDQRELAFRWSSIFSLVWNTNDDGTMRFSVESMHIVILLPFPVQQRQRSVRVTLHINVGIPEEN